MLVPRGSVFIAHLDLLAGTRKWKWQATARSLGIMCAASSFSVRIRGSNKFFLKHGWKHGCEMTLHDAWNSRLLFGCLRQPVLLQPPLSKLIVVLFPAKTPCVNWAAVQIHHTNVTVLTLLPVLLTSSPPSARTESCGYEALAAYLLGWTIL